MGTPATRSSSRTWLTAAIANAVVLVMFPGSMVSPALAQVRAATPTLTGEIGHAQLMNHLFPGAKPEAQSTVPVIPQTELDLDPTGGVGSFQPNGPTTTAVNAFFQSLGTNGRTCFTCHQPQDGWTISVSDIRARFNADPTDPLFQVIDGATCPNADVSTQAAQLNAYQLLLTKGLIRIGLPLPPGLQFKITSVNDPYNCNNNPTTGLTSPTTGVVSTYRRPLPTTNLGFLTTIMWDGREPSLSSQAADATLIHAQATAPPTQAQLQQFTGFELGVFAAQEYDNKALYLDDGVSGGPVNLSRLVSGFFIGINHADPTAGAFNPLIFNLYNAWSNLQGQSRQINQQESIARGQSLFNTMPINITGVAGLNDVLGQPTIVGTCGTCHDTPDVANHSLNALFNTGVTGAGATQPSPLETGGLPVFNVTCTWGALAGQTFQFTDLGLATITGSCADLGKIKVPILRGLAARAPYFHNGTAPNLNYVVDFYNNRFNIGFTDQQETDLVNFLNSL
jgi:cytochrome c peroxidase